VSDHEPTPIARRDFLKVGGVAAAGFLASSALPEAAGALPPLPSNPATDLAMPTRNLGRTGFRTGIFSLGGQAAVEQPNNFDVAVPIVERAIDLGVNYIDTAAAYGGPQRWSQQYIGRVMARRRREVFLASKTNDRTRDGSLRLLDESLRLLNTDHLDLWQLHNITRMEQVEQIFGPGGAIEALTRARDQRMVRFLGFSGHADPDVLVAMMERFPFDTILMALNAADPHQKSFQPRLLPMAVERQMGIIGMKIPARGRILRGWTPPPAGQGGFGQTPNQTEGTITHKEALYYTLSFPVSTVIVGCDSIAQVEENVRFAAEFTPLSAAQLADLQQRTAAIARQALFFRSWT
jgi:hypothetical protein